MYVVSTHFVVQKIFREFLCHAFREGSHKHAFVTLSPLQDFIQQIVDKQIIKINGNPATFEQAQVFVLAYGIVFLVYAALQVVVAVLTKIAEKQIESDKKGMHITMIVLGAIGGGILPLLGGIFALVSQVQKSDQQNQ